MPTVYQSSHTGSNIDIAITKTLGCQGLPSVSNTDSGKMLQVVNGLWSAVQPDSNLTMASVLNTVYPVGAIYLSVNSTSPATLFGGTWEQIKDKFLLGVGDTYTTAGATGGAASQSYTPAGTVGNHTLTTAEIPGHTHGLNDHVHSVGAHAHGLNSHYHSVQAHSHGLNSHTHGGGTHTHGLNSHTHTGPSHSHGYMSYGAGFLQYIGDTRGGWCVKLSGNLGSDWYNRGGMQAAGTGNTGGATGNTGNNSTFSTGQATGSTANNTAFNTGNATGSTANSAEFNTGGNTGNTTSTGGDGAHNHGFTGTEATINTLPPYLTVYMWKRTA